MPLRLIATCALGLECILETELRSLGFAEVRRERSAVSFSGRWIDVYRANWRLRSANRVLVELGAWDGADGDALAAGAAEMVTSARRWDGLSAGELFEPQRSFAIRATTSHSQIRDRRWVAVRVKDGIVDAQRRRYRKRATVDRNDPDVQLRVWLHRDRATLLLDTSGDSLDRRGYRVAAGPAPVREQVAAACVLAAAWDGQGPVVDPMCGGGTLLAEAGAYALGLAPGRLRESWGFERLPGFQAGVWRAVRNEPLPMPPAAGGDVQLLGIDEDSEAVRAARANLRRAELDSFARVDVGDAFAFEPPPGPGLLLINPPFGERLDQMQDQWPRIGDLMKQRYQGYRAVILAGDPDKGKHIGLKPRQRTPIRLGPLDAKILTFEIY